MKYKELEKILIDNFKTYHKKRDVIETSKSTGLKIQDINKLYDIWVLDNEFAYNEWVKELINLSDKDNKIYHSKLLDQDFIILYDGTVVFKDRTIYLKYEWEKLKDCKDIKKIHEAKQIFKPSEIQ